ncbi:hypothetical protein BH20BAC1_BH20BAC1_10920 [soil metagenome]
MKHRSKKERFYFDVGEAMSMSNMRCFINMETLEVDIHVGEDAWTFDETEDTAIEAMNNPGKFLELETVPTHQSFRIMEAFIETVKDKSLQAKLVHALEKKRPFANFKFIIDNSNVRQQWFGFRDDAYTAIAKEWIEENAGDDLKEKIKALPDVYIVE